MKHETEKTRAASSAFRFVRTMGIVNLFADMTYEGGASINGRFALRAITSSPDRIFGCCATRLVATFCCCTKNDEREPPKPGDLTWL